MTEETINYIERISAADSSQDLLRAYLEARTAKVYPPLRPSTLQFVAAKRLQELGDTDHAFKFTELAERSTISEEDRETVDGLHSASINMKSAVVDLNQVIKEAVASFNRTGEGINGELHATVNHLGGISREFDRTVGTFSRAAETIREASYRMGRSGY